MKHIMPFVALFLGFFSLFLTIWIIVRAPHRVFWLISIITSEWSLFFGITALLGAFAGVLSVRWGAPTAGYLSIVSGAMGVFISLYPLLVTRPVALSNEVDLSLGRYFSAPPSANGIEVETHAYSDANGSPLSLDVYARESSEIRPAVVVVHGGSWNGGERSDFPHWNNWLVKQGYVVFDIDYRLSPQPNWQTATRDVQDAVRWIKAHSHQFGIDANRLAILGRSAGAHLALQAAYTGNGAPDTHVQAVIAFYPPVDLKWGYENPAYVRVNDGSAQLRAFTGGTPQTVPEVYQKASPLSYVHNDTPPTLLIHGEKDQLVAPHHSILLHRALLNANRGPGRHRVLFIPYGQHGFDFNFNGWGSQVTQGVLLDHLRAINQKP